MRIALVSTCALPTPPDAYGGTELVVAALAKELIVLGHEVTVYATGDSHAAGDVRWVFAKHCWPPDTISEQKHVQFAWNDIRAQKIPFDVVHVQQAHSLELAGNYANRTALTIHHARSNSLVEHYVAFPEVSFVAISARQAELIPEVPIARVIHHRLDPAGYRFGSGEGGYCLFLGRLSAQKAPHIAIDAARHAGALLRIAGEAHPDGLKYFERKVKPRLADTRRVEWLGEAPVSVKTELLRAANALLFPLGWEEPFGLVMIESMLVGTPVIAFARGSAPEVIDEGVTGYLVRDEAEMSYRLKRIVTFDRKRCRQRALERWSAGRMARNYQALYEQISARHPHRVVEEKRSWTSLKRATTPP
ncbi:MAG: glycosyltransferase family 4 protein [Polyangiaceae bacterium]